MYHQFSVYSSSTVEMKLDAHKPLMCGLLVRLNLQTGMGIGLGTYNGVDLASRF